jgi:hypothetical protein
VFISWQDLPAVFIAVVVDLVAGTVTAEESAAGGARTVSVSGIVLGLPKLLSLC